MSKLARDAVEVLHHAEHLEPEPGDAIALLMDAAAVKMNELDVDPNQAVERLWASFNRLHIEEHRGRTQ